jgi:hypothetical protein
MATAVPLMSDVEVFDESGEARLKNDFTYHNNVAETLHTTNFIAGLEQFYGVLS